METSFTKSLWLMIDYWGRLSNNRGILVDCNSRFSGSSKMERCMPAQLLECKSPDYVFYSHFTFMYNNEFKFSESENPTLMDCEAKCLNNSSCVAYASTLEDAQTGCEIWTSIPARFNDLQTQMQGQYTSLIQQLISLLHTQLKTLKLIIDVLHVRVENKTIRYPWL